MASRDDWDESPVFEEDARDALRSYVVTGGRTRVRTSDLGFETLVSAAPSTDGRLRFERAELIDLCSSPMSLAEISAHLKIPIGTVRVLVDDLLDEGLLTRHRSANAETKNDRNLISRIIAGVRNI